MAREKYLKSGSGMGKRYIRNRTKYFLSNKGFTSLQIKLAKKVSKKSVTGFTIIELMIAATILAGIFTVVYASYFGIMGAIISSRNSSDVYQIALRATDIISKDLTGAHVSYPEEEEEGTLQAIEISEEMDVQFLGSNNALNFLSTSGVAFSSDSAKSGLMEIGYYIGEDKHFFRREDDWLDKDIAKGGEAFDFGEEFEKVSFEYFDEKEWKESWNSSDDKKLPKAVKITLEIKDRRGTFNCSKIIVIPTSQIDYEKEE